ncbi:hypothetical protein [Nisaea sp.]
MSQIVHHQPGEVCAESEQPVDAQCHRSNNKLPIGPPVTPRIRQQA